MRSLLTSMLLLVLFGGILLSPVPSRAQTVRQIVFPVIGNVKANNDFGAQRAGHLHEGNDILGAKMMPLVSAVDGTVTYVTYPEPDWGYSITIEDSDGYQYRYLHMNNDTPGTDDHRGGGMNAFAPDIESGNPVVKGQLVGWMGDSGNAEGVTSHLHFELRLPNGTPIDPYPSLTAATRITTPAAPPALDGEILPYAQLHLTASVALGNFDQDSDPEILVGAGPGGGPHVRMFETSGQTMATSFFAYREDLRMGIDVAAGDIDGDGIDEIITAAGPGAGPHIKIFKADGKEIGGFYAYFQDFMGGVRVAAADLDGDRKAEIITGPISLGGPHVKTFKPDGTVIASFMAYDPNFLGGIDVTAAPAIGANPAVIATGAGIEGGPHVKIFTPLGTLEHEFMAFGEDFKGGVRIALNSSSGNTQYGSSSASPEILIAPASGGGPDFRVFRYDGTQNDSYSEFEEWWQGGYDIASKGTVRIVVPGQALMGPGRRTSIRQLQQRSRGNYQWPWRHY